MQRDRRPDAGRYEVDVHTDFAAVPQADWDALVGDAIEQTVFQQYGWIRAWWETSRPPDARLHLITARLNASLVAAAPLYESAAEPSGGEVELRFLGGFHNDYQLFLAHRDHPASLDAVLSRALRRRESLRAVHFREVAGDSQFCRHLMAAGGLLVPLDPTPCPALDLKHDADVSRHWTKSSVTRKLNRLRRAGSFDLRHEVATPRILEGLPALVELHQKRWADTDSPSLFLDPKACDFYRRVVEELAPKGEVVYSHLTLDGRVIACHLGLVSGSDFLWYKPAYDPDFAELSPGLVMLAEIIRMASEAGYRRLDFTRGDEAFKARFSNQVRHNVNLIAYGSVREFAAQRTRRFAQTTYRAVRRLLRGV